MSTYHKPVSIIRPILVTHKDKTNLLEVDCVLCDHIQYGDTICVRPIGENTLECKLSGEAPANLIVEQDIVTSIEQKMTRYHKQLCNLLSSVGSNHLYIDHITV
jgi:hypothetical protein